MSIKSSLKFINYIVEDIQFKNNIEFDNKEIKIDFDIDSNVNFIEEDKFILSLAIEIFKEPIKNNFPFNLKLSLVGIFEVKDVEEKDKIKFAEQNAVTILFPYVRALITGITASANIEPLILPPINVINYIKEKRSK